MYVLGAVWARCCSSLNISSIDALSLSILRSRPTENAESSKYNLLFTMASFLSCWWCIYSISVSNFSTSSPIAILSSSNSFLSSSLSSASFWDFVEYFSISISLSSISVIFLFSVFSYSAYFFSPNFSWSSRSSTFLFNSLTFFCMFVISSLCFSCSKTSNSF